MDRLGQWHKQMTRTECLISHAAGKMGPALHQWVPLTNVCHTSPAYCICRLHGTTLRGLESSNRLLTPHTGTQPYCLLADCGARTKLLPGLPACHRSDTHRTIVLHPVRGHCPGVITQVMHCPGWSRGGAPMCAQSAFLHRRRAHAVIQQSRCCLTERLATQTCSTCAPQALQQSPGAGQAAAHRRSPRCCT